MEEKIIITTLIENNQGENPNLKYEHGLSLFIEVDGLKILFDTGQSAAFYENAQILGKNLLEIDYFINSHSHYDHTGGVKTFYEKTSTSTEFIVGAEFFLPKYKTDEYGMEKYIGFSLDEDFFGEKNIKINKISDEVYRLSEKIFVFHHFKKYNDFEIIPDKFYIKENGLIKKDQFLDEIALAIKTEKGIIIVVGCSHFGILNIIYTIKEYFNQNILAIIGGTHLIEADEIRLSKTVEELRKINPSLIAAMHCTGETGMQKLKEEFGEKFIYNNTGKIIKF